MGRALRPGHTHTHQRRKQPGDRFRHSAHHTNHPLAHWHALKTTVHWTVHAPATNNTLPATWLTLARNVAAYVRRLGMTQMQRWILWPADGEQTIRSRTDSLRTHANKMRNMHRPREGHRPAYNIFQGR